MPPNARELIEPLVGTTVYTLGPSPQPNMILRIRGANVVVRTNESGEDGADVALRYIQDGLDILYAQGRIRIAPETFNRYRRSSFIGAVLATLPGVVATPPPVWLELVDTEAQAPLTSPAQDHPPFRGYPNPETSAAVDLAGVEVALAAIAGRFGGLEVVRMPQNNPGYDVAVRDADGLTVAYIEIKSTSTAAPTFFMSEHERRFAEHHADRYHLIVVTNVDIQGRTGDVRWRSGALAGDDVDLRPRQWLGRLS